MATISRLGEQLDLDVKQGSTFTVRATMKQPAVPPTTPPTYVPVDLTGVTVRGQVRRKFSDAAPAASFACSVTDAVNGEYTFELPEPVTAAMEAGDRLEDAKSRYVWDLEMVHPGGRVTPLYYGTLRLLREVTRP